MVIMQGVEKGPCLVQVTIAAATAAADDDDRQLY